MEKEIFEQHPKAQQLFLLDGNYYLSLSDRELAQGNYKVIKREDVVIKPKKNKE